jgi:hypothetical protein
MQKKDEEEEEKEINETTLRTKAALEKIVNVRLSATQQKKNVPQQSSEATHIKYTPSQQSVAFNSGAKQRIIRMVEMPKDRLQTQEGLFPSGSGYAFASEACDCQGSARLENPPLHLQLEESQRLYNSVRQASCG